MGRIIVQENYGELIEAEVIQRVLIIAGDAGVPGRPGEGVAPGGLTGQHLFKVTDDDYDTDWETPPDPNIPLNQLTDVSVPAPNNNDQLVFDADTQTWRNGRSAGALGFTELSYRWNTPPDSTPSAGQISTDNADPTLTTVVYFNKNDANANDLSLWFPYMKEGDWLNIHDDSDTSQHWSFDVLDTPVLNGDVWEVSVTPFSNMGTDFTNNEAVRVFWRSVDSDPERMRWRNKWQSDTEYLINDTVYDDGWAMVANKTTFERPSPQAVGDPYYLYTGTGTVDQELAKIITYGMRYTFDVNGYINSYRVYTFVGYHYSIYSIFDPDGVGEITEIANFTAQNDGWQEFSLAPIMVTPGVEFSLAQRISEPASTPVTWNGNWNYTTPNNSTAPASGEAQHANNDTGIIYINKTDSDATDRSTALEALSVGDVIDNGAFKWTILSITDLGTYIAFGLSPTTQTTPDGIINFIFETVEATPIDYYHEVDFWNGNPNIASFYNIDDGATIVGNEQFGIDLNVQNATIAEDWDLLSAPGGGGGGGSAEVPESGITKNIWKFAVHKDTAQSLPTGQDTKVIWEQKDFDTNLDFANNEYTASFDGYWHFDVSIVTTTASGFDRFQIKIFKNGVWYKTLVDANFPSNSNAGYAGGLDMQLAQGDVISVYVQPIGGSPQISADIEETSFSGFLIANFADEQDGLIDTGDITDGAVTTPKIGDDAVTPDKRSGGFAVGSVVVTGDGNLAITGLGFMPKLVQFTGAISSTGGVGNIANGTMAEDGSMNNTYFAGRYVSGTQYNKSGGGVGSCLQFVGIASSGDVAVQGTVKYGSMDADGFTVVISNYTQDNNLRWQAFG